MAENENLSVFRNDPDIARMLDSLPDAEADLNPPVYASLQPHVAAMGAAYRRIVLDLLASGADADIDEAEELLLESAVDMYRTWLMHAMQRDRARAEAEYRKRQS